ncbi:M28 family peptidase [Opitutus sp. ER46]|uniref:M28 family peptidase n=1 Tax=Opitutus sp. ER46 TaxID=2161864 RepID=UPI000D2FEECB|nr:M28 family peptidase [Opitutus sp. ER46]PTX92547.1 peptidase M28 [Opitutus sp. ER46]
MRSFSPLVGALLAGLAPLLAAAAPTPAFSPARILERTKVLASDEFEGRAPGSAGEEKTVNYLVGEFRQLGLTPGNPDGTYIQQVPLVGITSRPTLSFTVGGEQIVLQPSVDFVGPTSRSATHLEVKASDVVFVGYGIVAPEYGWDDYKGVDVRGKTIVMLINDPPVTDPRTGQLDPKVFAGEGMTYYGRWTYKYEIAAEKGAAACLIVHETKPAAYPFSVVVSSRSRENFEIRTPDGNAGRAAMDGWLTLDAARRLFTAAGQDYDALKQAALARDFRPVPLKATASFTIDSTLRQVDSRNVVALLPGSDPKLRDEYVVYTSHWDHLGRDLKLEGDQIFNGAGDNASGTAVLVELAQAFHSLPAASRPRRSILFLSVTAEEKGLLGSGYYARHPLYPLRQTVADINMDGANPYGPTSDMETIGFGASTIDDIGIAVAQRQGRTMKPESHPEHGSYYRSDHFEFAKVGVPSYYPKTGRQYLGKPADFGEKVIQDYIAHHYHQVSDEVRPDWTFEGAAQDAEFLFLVGLEIANAPQRPTWKPGSEFAKKAQR